MINDEKTLEFIESNKHLNGHVYVKMNMVRVSFCVNAQSDGDYGVFTYRIFMNDNPVTGYDTVAHYDISFRFSSGRSSEMLHYKSLADALLAIKDAPVELPANVGLAINELSNVIESER